MKTSVEVIDQPPAVRFGGWLLAEDFDSDVTDGFVEPGSDNEELGNRIVRGIRTLLSEAGADTVLGHKLPRLPREAGQEDVGADAYRVIAGGAAYGSCRLPTSPRSPISSSTGSSSRENSSNTS